MESSLDSASEERENARRSEALRKIIVSRLAKCWKKIKECKGDELTSHGLTYTEAMDNVVKLITQSTSDESRVGSFEQKS